MAGDREREIVTSFIKFADYLVEDFDLLDLTVQLTEDCAQLLDVAAAGLLLADAGGVLHLLAATSEHARALEVFQLQREEGPCLDCYRLGVPVSVADLRANPSRWPRFAAVAANKGFVSVHAIPIRLRSDVLGALGLFGATAGGLNDDDLNVAQGLAHLAAIALLAQSRALTRESLLPQLHAAVAGRATLEMAKGVLAEAQRVDMQEALTRLRRYAAQRNERLSDLARRVVSADGQARRTLLAELGGSASAADQSRADK